MMSDKERRMYHRWKNYKLSDLTQKEQKKFLKWQREMRGDMSTKPRKKRKMSTRKMEYDSLPKPESPKGFWAKAKRAISPTAEDRRYKLREKKRVLREKVEVARLEKQLRQEKNTGGRDRILSGMMGGGSKTSKEDSMKRRRRGLDMIGL